MPRELHGRKLDPAGMFEPARCADRAVLRPDRRVGDSPEPGAKR